MDQVADHGISSPRGESHVAPGTAFDRLLAYIWYGLLVPTVLIFLGLKEGLQSVKGVQDNKALTKRRGHVAVLTGATGGIGVNILKKLLQLDYQVIIGVRNPEAGLKAIESIRDSGVITGKTKCLQLDLKSLQSVRRFASELLKDVDRVDLLINNAGVLFLPYELTEDGYETHFQVNYLSHFLLTQLLLPRMKSAGVRKGSHSRVVNVSSIGHLASCAYNIGDVTDPRVYSEFRGYYDSKLCQILHAKYLDAKLTSEGASVRAYAVHPGVITTDLYSSVSFYRVFMRMSRKFFRNCDDGADVVMYAAISPDIETEGGLYIADSKIGIPGSMTEDVHLQEFLWKLSEDCVSKKL